MLKPSKIFSFTWCKLSLYRTFYRSTIPEKYNTEILVENQQHPLCDKRNELEEWLAIQQQRGIPITQNISQTQYQFLLNARSNRQRLNILQYCHRREKYVQKEVRKKSLMKKRLEERAEIRSNSHIKYGLWQNCLFLKVFQPCKINFYSHRLASAVLHGQPIVIDMGFEKHMNLVEKKLLEREILSSIRWNMKSREPFNLTICNANLENSIMENVKQSLPKNFPLTLSPQSYRDLFRKDKLIYLTKDATEEMVKFDHEAVYIIGGLVDHGQKHPITFEKAKEEGIQTLKLPLVSLSNKLLLKDFTLNIPHVVKILVDLKETGDWRSAFQKLPQWQIHRVNNNFKPRLGIDEGLIVLESIR